MTAQMIIRIDPDLKNVETDLVKDTFSEGKLCHL